MASQLKPSLSKQLEKVFKIAAESKEGKKLFGIVPRDQVLQFEPEDGEPFHARVTMKGAFAVGEGVVPFQRFYVSRLKSSWDILEKLLTGARSFTDVYMDDDIEIYGEWDIRNWFGTILRIARESGGRI